MKTSIPLLVIAFALVSCAIAKRPDIQSDAPVVTLLDSSNDSPDNSTRHSGVPTLEDVDPSFIDTLRNYYRAKAEAAGQPTLNTTGRVAYGKYAPSGLLPFATFLSIRTGSDGVQCGGSLIAPRVIVTAAHCLYGEDGKADARSIQAVIGDIDMNRVTKIYKGKAIAKPKSFNPKLNGGSVYGDVALIYLTSAANVAPVALDDGTYTKAGGWYVTAGWGKTETASPSDLLKWAAVPSMSNSEYQSFTKSFRGYTGNYPPSLSKDHFPAGLGDDKADSCQGDSGGPLISPGPKFSSSKASQNVLVGVVSYGLTDECGTLNIGYYTSIAYWNKWIKDTIAKNKW